MKNVQLLILVLVSISTKSLWGHWTSDCEQYYKIRSEIVIKALVSKNLLSDSEKRALERAPDLLERTIGPKKYWDEKRGCYTHIFHLSFNNDDIRIAEALRVSEKASFVFCPSGLMERIFGKKTAECRAAESLGAALSDAFKLKNQPE